MWAKNRRNCTVASRGDSSEEENFVIGFGFLHYDNAARRHIIALRVNFLCQAVKILCPAPHAASPGGTKSVNLEHDALFIHHLAQIDKGITHATKCRIDTHPGGIGNFLEAHIAVEAHGDNLALIVGQKF